MRTVKSLVAVCAVLLLFASCATTGSGNVNTKNPEYAEGKALGESMAEEHRSGIVCSSKSRFQALKAAKKETDKQRAQGKSEDFCAGFARGYQDVYEYNVVMRCLD